MALSIDDTIKTLLELELLTSKPGHVPTLHIFAKSGEKGCKAFVESGDDAVVGCGQTPHEAIVRLARAMLEKASPDHRAKRSPPTDPGTDSRNWSAVVDLLQAYSSEWSAGLEVRILDGQLAYYADAQSCFGTHSSSLSDYGETFACATELLLRDTEASLAAVSSKETEKRARVLELLGRLASV